MRTSISNKRVLNKPSGGRTGGRGSGPSQGNSRSNNNYSSFKQSDRSEVESQRRADNERVETIFGFEKIRDGAPRLGWLLNYLPVVCIPSCTQ